MAFKTIEEIDEAGDKLGGEYRLNLQCPPTKWTGWKYCGYDVTARKEEMVKDWDAGFVAQVIWYKMRGSCGSQWPAEYGYYVNLPDMQSGKFTPGGSFDIGHERMMANAPAEDVETMVEAGWNKLVAIVKDKEGIDISKLRIEKQAA